MKLKFLIFTSILLVFLIAGFFPILAQHFSSSDYIIDWGNFNITSGQKNSPNYSLTDTVGQNAPGPYTSNGFILKSGFEYIYDTFNQFSFSIDNLAINLGSLTPQVGSTATNIITITTPSGHGYQVMAQENHPLSQSLGITIPDTACNVGTTCTDTTANVWNSASAYGFGFNAIGINNSAVATGIGTSNYFLDSTYFRPFDPVPPKTSQIVMSETSPVKNRSARVSYKANISTLQAAGSYQNSIIFTAIPKYGLFRSNLKTGPNRACRQTGCFPHPSLPGNQQL
jgi:hypothetical protein